MTTRKKATPGDDALVVLTGLTLRDAELELAICSANQSSDAFLLDRAELRDPDGDGDQVAQRGDLWMLIAAELRQAREAVRRAS